MANIEGERQGFYPEDVEDVEDEQFFEDYESYEDDLDDDEAFEAMEDDYDDDEAFETFEDDLDDDEALEAMEDDLDDDEGFEDDLDDDEALEAMEDDYDDDEAFEDDLDDDEAFESAEALEELGEAGLAAELTARQRRARWKRRMRARRRARTARARVRAMRARQLAIRRARAARSKLGRFLNIRAPGRQIRIRRIGKLSGRGVVTARLPNGMTTRMMFTPPLAKVTDVNRLTRRININDRRTGKAIRAQGKAIAKARTALKASVKTLTANQAKTERALSKRIASGDSKLATRITKEVGGQRMALRRHRTRTARLMRRDRRRALFNAATVGLAIPAFKAYGNEDNVFARRNFELTGIMVGALLADELFDYVLPARGKASRTIGFASTAISTVAAVATPVIANLIYQEEKSEGG